MGSRESDPLMIGDSESDSESEAIQVQHVQVQHVVPYTIRGPKNLGYGPIDEHCVWGNTFQLDAYKCGYLNDLIDRVPGKPFKHYVYKLSNSTVIQPNCKMEFSAKFTSAYLTRHLDEPIIIRVHCTTSDKYYKVKMTLGRCEKNLAMLTSGWAKAVRRFDLQGGALYIFTFAYRRNGQLKLLIDPLN